MNGFQTFFTCGDVGAHTESLQPRDDNSSNSEDEDSQALVERVSGCYVHVLIIAAHHGVGAHSYADDTQLYLHTTTDNCATHLCVCSHALTMSVFG